MKWAAFLLGFLLATGVLAQGLAEGKWWKRPRIAQELQLTPEQDAELDRIFVKSKPRLIDLRADLEKKQLEYEQAMLGDTTDRTVIETKIEQREEARARLQKELSLMELDMKQALKPEQRARLMRLREQNRQKLQERRRRFRDGESDTERPPRAGKRKPANAAPPNR